MSKAHCTSLFYKVSNPAAYLLSSLVLLLGLLLTGIAAYYTKTDIEHHGYQAFVVECEELKLKIQARLEAHKQALLSVAAMFDASEEVTREEWRSYVQRLRLFEHFEGIQGLGFSLWIPTEDLPQHIAGIRAEGFPEYTVHPEGQREAYSSIILLQPFEDLNLRAFGFDMYAEPVRRAAMARARDENAVVLSGKVRLVLENDNNIQAGTLMYVPVYKKNSALASLVQRRAALMGWVFSPFRMTDLLHHIIKNSDSTHSAHLHLQVYDGTQALPENLLYKSEAQTPAGASPLFQWETQADFNGTLWTLYFEYDAGINESLDYSKAWITLCAGTLSSGLLFFLLRSYFMTRRNADKIAGELTAQLRESEQRFRLLADSAPVLIWSARTDKLCDYFNKVWFDFTGRTFEQEFGNGWAEGVHADDFNACLETYVQAFDARKPFRMEYRLRRHDGEYRWLLDTGVPRFTSDQKFIGYIGCCVDITDRYEAEQALKISEQKLAASSADLVQFTNIAAHHLQEPSRRMVSFVQRLKNALQTLDLTEEVLMPLEFIEQSAIRQRALVHDIQLYLAATNPRSVVETQAVSDIVAKVLKQHAGLIDESKAQIDLGLLPDVTMDRPRLYDLFNLLLHNALRYHHPGRRPNIRVYGVHKAKRVLYCIEDNGMGIPMEYRERVFLVFERLQVGTDQDSTGIGLAIVRRIVESCGGAVSLHETAGGGITVLFDLPEGA